MKKTYRILGLVCILFALSCDLDKDLDNPNEVGLSTADPTLLMNGIQRDLAGFFERVSGADRVNTRGVDELIRHRVMSGGFNYQTAYTPQNLDETWQWAYQKVLVNIEAMLPLAEEANLTTHIGAGKIIKAYVLMTLVDMFGDVPATEALKGTEAILNPNVDPGATVYTMAIDLLDEARTELAKTGADAGAGLSRDIFYNGDRENWTALANSLELKAQLNMTVGATAVPARINTLLGENLIDTDAEEFTYKYGTAAVPSTSRHPYYTDTYRPVAGSANGWIGNMFLKEMFNGLGVQDPRWRYYFYRQVGSLKQALSIDPKSITCLNANAQVTGTPSHYTSFYSNLDRPVLYCAFDPGFYGRDHGNAEGRNPDAQVVVAPGVYPVGGRVDTNPTGAAGNPNYAVFTQLGQGANGAGILPIYMSFFTDFMKAEIQIRLGGTPAAAKSALEAGVNKSIDRVRAFGVSRAQTLPAGLEPEQVIYLSTLSASWDAATTNAQRMDIIGKEYWKALWGNGLEAYNLYRRTSTPTDMQPVVRATQPGLAGPFWRSIVYPAVFANLNANAPSNEGKATRKVFWDTNPDDLD
ncbi:MAG: SusD/RagB family nutrient-binding outer membrane lipoprotein [Cyclobacteriaceae bacterium]|nr:SusD/RagB family nutrient-binding outer membrane lipoprotein [Cyclobacteriaceae bacterium]